MILHMSEYDEQCAVVGYCDMKNIPCYHIPNEGKRSRTEGARQKRQGLRPGFPDLCIPRARGKYHSLYIELKDIDGKPTPEQLEWIARLREEGMRDYACIGAYSAIALIDKYMALDQ